MGKRAKKSDGDKRFVWRDEKSGRYLDVTVADPGVTPRGVTVEKIKKAVAKSGGGTVRDKAVAKSTAGPSRSKSK